MIVALYLFPSLLILVVHCPAQLAFPPPHLLMKEEGEKKNLYSTCKLSPTVATSLSLAMSGGFKKGIVMIYFSWIINHRHLSSSSSSSDETNHDSHSNGKRPQPTVRVKTSRRELERGRGGRRAGMHNDQIAAFFSVQVPRVSSFDIARNHLGLGLGLGGNSIIYGVNGATSNKLLDGAAVRKLPKFTMFGAMRSQDVGRPTAGTKNHLETEATGQDESGIIVVKGFKKPTRMLFPKSAVA